MKNNIPFLRNTFALLMLVVLFGLGAAQAQDRDRYLNSAKPGGINVASVDVTVKQQGVNDWQQLISSDELVVGEVL